MAASLARTVSVIIPMFWPERRKNLRPIVQALRVSTIAPIEIIVWNNDTPLTEVLPPEVSVIQCYRNVGCKARFLAAMCAKGDYVLFHDNDLTIHPRTLEQLLDFSERAPNSIVACGWGRRLNGGLYSQSEPVDGALITQPTPVDLSFGRCELVSRALVNSLLSELPFDETMTHDDVWFSYVAAKHQINRWIIPTSGTRGQTDIEGHDQGIWHSPGFYRDRDVICRQLFPPTR